MSDSVPSATKRLVGYYPASDIHAQNYQVTDIPANLLSHVIYAFANVTAEGACVSVNPEDDQVNFPQLQELQEEYPQLLMLISVGGANHSTNFPAVCASPVLRANLARSCVEFMTQNAFDGIDIDWEFPGAADSANFTALLQELRSQLDAQGDTDGYYYLLTIAAPAGPSNIANLPLPQIHPLLDWINLESYDFSTASSRTTNFNAPLFTEKGGLNVSAAVNSYLAAGVPPDKVVVGVRFVGTGWQGVGPTNNGLYQPDTGPAPGTWDLPSAPPSGSFGYQDIKDNYLLSYTRSWDSEAQAPWLYNAATGIMLSYEDPQSLAAKANYVLANQLGGMMIWELGADDDEHTLLNALAAALGYGSGTFPGLNALWVYSVSSLPNPVTDETTRDSLIQDSSSSCVSMLYVSVYSATPNSAGRYMYDDSDIADLISKAHAQGMQVYAAYGDSDWPTLGCAPSEFPMLRMAEVIAYNSANQSATFDGVILDVEPSGTPDFQALLELYQCFQQQAQASGMGLSVAISAFWKTTVTFGSTTKEVYKQIVDLNLNNVVVMGYRNFAGSSDCTAGDGVVCLDKDLIAYANSVSQGNTILVGLDTDNPATSGSTAKETFFSMGQAAMNAVPQSVFIQFAAVNQTFGGFAVHNYRDSYLNGTLPGWPATNRPLGVENTSGSAQRLRQ
jgi:GH18 family chitinase